MGAGTSRISSHGPDTLDFMVTQWFCVTNMGQSEIKMWMEPKPI